MSWTVVVTRGGFGQAWSFPNIEQADEHAIPQFGDAFCQSGEDVLAVFRPEEYDRLVAAFEDEKARLELSRISDQHARAAWVYNFLVKRAPRPPKEPAEVLRIVGEDRRATRTSGVRSRIRTDDMTKEATAAKEPKAPKEKKVPAPRSKFAKDSVITFGKNKDGVEYGPENNPKRAGSAAHKRFALYKSGATIEEARSAGVTAGDINWDVGQGFIKLG